MMLSLGEFFIKRLEAEVMRYGIVWVVPLSRIQVTTRTIVFLAGDPYKPSFAIVTGRGDNPRYSLTASIRLWHT